MFSGVYVRLKGMSAKKKANETMDGATIRERGMTKKRPVIVEAGVVAGNVYDKYETKNPIARKMMQGFENTVKELVLLSAVTDIHEVGCGEGHLSSELMAMQGVSSVRGSDFSTQIIDMACRMHGSEGIVFKTASIYELDSEKDSAELIVCCEVLEHLEEPRRALQVIQSLARPYCLLSVPREPLWRFLNIIRGKYMSSLGNTPGHIQHWSKQEFVQIVSRYFKIEEIRNPLPWTMLLCRRR